MDIDYLPGARLFDLTSPRNVQLEATQTLDTIRSPETIRTLHYNNQVEIRTFNLTDLHITQEEAAEISHTQRNI